jgi:hypothetical protein
MPIHDWTRVSAGTFHDFHQGRTIDIRNRLSSGVVPDAQALADFAQASHAVAKNRPSSRLP